MRNSSVDRVPFNQTALTSEIDVGQVEFHSRSYLRGLVRVVVAEANALQGLELDDLTR